MKPTVSGVERIYALQHLETGEFICLLQDGVDYLACFSDGDTAMEFRSALGLQEHVTIYASIISNCPFTHFWLDGHNLELSSTGVAVS